MKILIWMLALSGLGCDYRYILIGYGYQKYEFFSQAVAAGVSVIMGFMLIPSFHKKGGAFCLITAVSVYCILVYYFVKKHVHQISFMPYVKKPLLSAGCMVVIFIIFNKFSFWIAACTSILSFILIMIILQPEAPKYPSLLLSQTKL